MASEVYEELLEVMKKRGGRYPGLDIPEFFAMAEELFTPQEAEVNNAMPRQPFTASELANLMDRDEGDVAAILEAMAGKGLCKTFLRDGVRYFQGAPFIVGIFEYVFIPGGSSERDKKLARLIHAYEKAHDSAMGAPQMTYPVSRVITVDRTIAAGNTVHTYDQMSTYIDKYDSIAVGTCYCRHTAKLRGEDVHGMPMDVCMWFDTMAEYAIERLSARKLTKQEAMEILDQSEEAGLVHMSRNTSDDIEFVCNCDRWHCGTVTTVLKQPKPALFFNSGFQPQFDPDLCVACEICLDRCPADALAMGEEGLPEVDLDRCFGCAVCASGCPSEAITLHAKPDFPVRPKDPKELVTAVKASMGK